VTADALRRADAVADAIARDAALYDQRGCLSPDAVYVAAEGRGAARDLAARLVAALAALGERLPPGRTRVEERAAARVAWDAAEHEPGAELLGAPGAGVILEDARPFAPGPGGRVLRVHPVPDLRALPALLPVGRVECVGVAGEAGLPPPAALAARGVARLCPVGRMQRPRLAWPRGQHPPLGALLGRAGPAPIQVER
jgi:hypothetical protein